MDGLLVKATDLDTGRHIANNLRLCSSLPSRLRGLIGRPPPEEGGGILIAPCSSVHTFLMKYPIDILFVGGDGRVLKAVHRMKPSRATLPLWRACAAVELPAGSIGKAGCFMGHRLAFSEAGKSHAL